MSGLHAKKMVVPIDFSDLSFAALDRAVEIAGDSGEVHAIHVLTSLSAMEPGSMYGTVTDETRIESVTKNLRKRLSDKKYANVAVHAVVGDAGRSISDFAEQEGADLIVISSHGYGFFQRLMLGSVAERVVRLAPCAVLVLRTLPEGT